MLKVVIVVLESAFGIVGRVNIGTLDAVENFLDKKKEIEEILWKAQADAPKTAPIAQAFRFIYELKKDAPKTEVALAMLKLKKLLKDHAKEIPLAA